MTKLLKIATRKSPLALWQAEFVKARLIEHYPNLQVELVTFVTKGDKILDVPLAKIGGKGLFIKELEVALLENKADIAVHSTKDLPMDIPTDLSVPVFMKREDPTDAFVSNSYNSLDDLPEGAVVGTSSLRRQTQLLAYRSDLSIKTLRGNVGTRLSKLDNEEYDAIILASSGLIRLGLENRIKQFLAKDVCLPAVGQGALAIETRKNDEAIIDLLAPLACKQTTPCILAERAFNKRLEGGCQVPIAGHAVLVEDELTLKGLVANADGSTIISAKASSNKNEAETLGVQVANQLLENGARDILKSFY